MGLAATGVGLLSTIIAAPVAIGIGAGTMVCGLLGDVGKLAGGRLQAKARKHDLIHGLAESKLNKIADPISVALNDDKITIEEFRLIFAEVNKFKQTTNEIHGCQKQSSGLSEDEKTDYFSMRETKP